MEQHDRDMIDRIEDPAIQTHIAELIDQLTDAKEEIDVLTFKVTNLTTEKRVANEEIERLKGLGTIKGIRTYDHALSDDGIKAVYDMESQLTAANTRADEAEAHTMRDANYQAKLEVKVKKLRDAIEDYINNDIGRKDTLRNLEQALADTEEK